MTRSLFGWDLPPGVTTRMIDEQCGDDEDCAHCGSDSHGTDDCSWGPVPTCEPIESDDYGAPCSECPKRGRTEPNLIDLSTGECSECDGERALECAALPDEEKERLADMAMEPRYPR